MVRKEMFNRFFENPNAKFKQKRTINGILIINNSKWVLIKNNLVCWNDGIFPIDMIIPNDKSEWEEILPEPTISALEYLNIQARLCRKRACSYCVLHNKCDINRNNNIEKINIVEKWAKENPEEVK